MKKEVGSLAMALMITTLLCFATGSHQHEEDGLRLPSQGDGGSRKPWSCCDQCLCTRSIPPQCRCTDRLVGGCDPNCKNCEQLPQRIYPPFFVCRDVIKDYCGDRCHPEPLLK